MLGDHLLMSWHLVCAASGCKRRTRNAKRPIPDALTLEPFFETYVTISWDWTWIRTSDVDCIWMGHLKVNANWSRSTQAVKNTYWQTWTFGEK